MPGRRRRDLALFVAIVAAFALLARVAGRDGLAPPPLPPLDALSPRQAPDFALPDLGGSTRRLGDHAGRVLLLNFWATWCAPCREELPALESLHRALGSEGLDVVAVSVDAGPPDAVTRFVEEQGLSFTVLRDASEQVARRYGVAAYPTSYVLDREGRVLHAAAGAFDWSAPESIAWLSAVLAQ